MSPSRPRASAAARTRTVTPAAESIDRPQPANADAGDQAPARKPDDRPAGVEDVAQGWAAAVRLRDSSTLRALAHPLRIALLDAVRTYGPLTATQAAAHVDDTPSNCSFHLRTLASFGLIEKAPSTDQRARPWQAVQGGVWINPDESSASRAAAVAVSEVVHSQFLGDLARWLEREPDEAAPWRSAWFDSSLVLWLSAEELTDIARQFQAMVLPFTRSRRTQPIGPNDRPVRMIGIAFPASPPPGGAGSPS